VAAIVVAAYVSVLLAELAGDRSMVAMASLTARFRPLPVFCGAAPAYALKMLAAVLLAGAVSRLGHGTIAVVSCATWLITAWIVGRRDDERDHAGAFARLRHPSAVAFASIAFTEWGDPGQLTAALIAASSKAPLLVWGGATAALLTKSAAAMVLGVTVRRYVALARLRFAVAAFCVVNAALAVIRP